MIEIMKREVHGLFSGDSTNQFSKCMSSTVLEIIFFWFSLFVCFFIIVIIIIIIIIIIICSYFKKNVFTFQPW